VTRSKKSDGASGVPAGEGGSAQDTIAHLRNRLSELEQQNKALRFSSDQFDLVRQQFSDLYDYAPVGYATVDEKGVIHRANLPAAALLGASRQEVTGVRLSSFVRPDERSAFAAFVKGAFSASTPTTIEVRLTRGKWRAEYVQLVASPGAAGRDLGHAGAQARIALIDITDRKRAEEALRASQQRFETVVSAMAEGVVVHDASGAIRSCNAAAERILGLSADEISGQKSIDPRWRAVHEDGSPFPGEDHPAMVVLRTGAPQQNVIMGVHRPDGARSWIRIGAEPLRGGDGAVEGAVATFADVTQERTREALLRASESKFRAYVEEAPVGMLVADAEGRLVDANPVGLRMLGVDREVLTSMSVVDFQDESAREGIRQDFLTMKPGDTRDREDRFHQPDGSELWASVRVVKLESGHFLAFCRDNTDERRAQENLARRKSMLRAVAHSIPAGAVVVVDGNLRCVFADGSRSYRGVDPSWYEGRTLAESFPPDLAARIERLARRALAGESTAIDVHLEGRVVALRAGPVSDREGLSDLCTIISHDVTEERGTTEALRVSEERLREVLDASWDGFWDRDLVAGMVLHSARMNEIVGLPAVDTVVGGDAWIDRMHPDDLPAIRPVYEALREQRRERFDLKYRTRHADGSWRWVRSRGKVTARDDAGKPTRISGTVTDIHDGMVSQLALRESESRFRALAASAPVGIFQTDATGSNVYLNPAGERITGMTAAEARGSGWSQAVHPEDRERVYREWVDAAREGRDFTSEYRFRSAAGKVTWVRGYGSPFLQVDGSPVGYIGVVVDLSEQRALQRKVAQTSHLAAMGALVAGIAHEINNPVNAIVNTVGPLEEALADLDRIGAVGGAKGEAVGGAKGEAVGGGASE
jgi:PAS domain S-box-containing protein